MRTLIIGCGYLGRRVADAWLADDHKVAALTRSQRHAEELRSAGIEPLVGDVTDLNSLSNLPAVDVVLYAVGFDRTAQHSKQVVYVDGLQNVLQAIGDRFNQFVYISSTSVYGQNQGEWIDADSPTVPTSESGKICLQAEQIVQSRLQSNAPAESARAVILRLAGIYGPGRLLRRIEAIKSQAPVAGNPCAWLNLIHVDDAVTAVCAATASTPSRSTYLVCDSQPVTRQSYYHKLAEVVGVSPPRFDEASEASSRVSGLGKRCSNSSLLSEFAMTLKYPSIEQGLPHAVDGSR